MKGEALSNEESKMEPEFKKGCFEYSILKFFEMWVVHTQFIGSYYRTDPIIRTVGTFFEIC